MERVECLIESTNNVTLFGSFLLRRGSQGRRHATSEISLMCCTYIGRAEHADQGNQITKPGPQMSSDLHCEGCDLKDSYRDRAWHLGTPPITSGSYGISNLPVTKISRRNRGGFLGALFVSMFSLICSRAPCDACAFNDDVSGSLQKCHGCRSAIDASSIDYCKSLMLG